MEKPKLVSDIMTREVVALYEEDNLSGVEEGMQRFRFRHLPVVDGNKLVGLITHRNLLQVAASSQEPGGEQKTRTFNERLFARDVMVRDVLTTRESTPLTVAGRMMWERKVGCLPVIHDDGTLVGILTEADFVRLAVSLLE